MNLGLGLFLSSRGGAAATFDPATLALKVWHRGSFTASPWAGVASAGSSGSCSASEATNPPTVGAALNGFTPAVFNGTNSILAESDNSATIFGSGTGVVAYAGLVYIDLSVLPVDGGASHQNPCLITDTSLNNFWVGISKTQLWVGVRDGVGVKETSLTITGLATGYHLVKARYNGTQVECALDGNAMSAQVAAGSRAVGSSTVAVGKNFSATKFFTGRIEDYCVGPLTNADYANYLAYCNARYGLTLT